MRIAVLGVGLIGGSVALAARRRLGAHVSGVDPVLDHSVVDGVGFADADIVVVATPVDTLEQEVRRALSETRGIVTDVGSVKRALVAAIDDERFIGGHPLAGAETGGVEHAREDLFDDATWYLTPTAKTSGVALEKLHRFITAIGARPAVIDAADHDRVMAAVSHLPHVLANVLVEQASQVLGGEILPPVGPSFRDATRVAGASPELWGQIYAANAEALGEQIDAVIARLQHLRLDGAWQADVAAMRARLLAEATGATQELRVSVPNQPGVVADLALTLGRAGINISDMSLAPSPDAASGVVGLWVPESDLDRARELIAQKGLAVS
jgi:prephenate dehydrogenase